MAGSRRLRIDWQFVRFLLVGVLNTAFGYGVFLLLLWAGLPTTPALLLAYVAGVMFNFRTISALVFGHSHGRLGRFAAVYVVLLGANWVALWTLTRAGVPPWLGQGVLTLPMAALSFAAQRSWVFATEPSPT